MAKARPIEELVELSQAHPEQLKPHDWRRLKALARPPGEIEKVAVDRAAGELPTFRRRLLENVLAMLTLREPQEAIAARCRDELGLADPSAVEQIVAEARENLSAATAVAQLQALYDTYANSDAAFIALGARRELNKLLCLYAVAPAVARESTVAPPPPSAFDEPGRPGRDEDDVFAAIDAELDPLLDDDPAASYATRVRQAARLIRRLKRSPRRKAK